MHQLMKHEEDLDTFVDRMRDLPHHLFMLNKEGHSPLDIAIFNSNTGYATLRQMAKQKNNDNTDIDDSRVSEALENAVEKAVYLIERMEKFGPECSLIYVKKP